MTVSEELESVKSEIISLQEQSEKTAKEIQALYDKKIMLQFQAVEETGILKGTNWTPVESNFGFCLELNDKKQFAKESITSKIERMFFSWEHDSVYYNDIEFGCSDGDIFLKSSDSSKLFDLVKKWGLIIDYSSYEKEIDKLENKKKEIQKFIDSVKTQM